MPQIMDPKLDAGMRIPGEIDSLEEAVEEGAFLNDLLASESATYISLLFLGTLEHTFSYYLYSTI